MLAGSISLLLLTGCPQSAPQDLLQPPPIPPENDLKFDTLYYDSIYLPHRSARTERERAISIQLDRLDGIREHRKHDREKGVTPRPDTNAIGEQIGSGNPVRHFANKAALLADIYHQIDSLKVLEHIPLTPH